LFLFLLFNLSYIFFNELSGIYLIVYFITCYCNPIRFISFLLDRLITISYIFLTESHLLFTDSHIIFIDLLKVFIDIFVSNYFDLFVF